MPARPHAAGQWKNGTRQVRLPLLRQSCNCGSSFSQILPDISYHPPLLLGAAVCSSVGRFVRRMRAISFDNSTPRRPPNN